MWAPRALTAPNWWASPPCGIAPGMWMRQIRQHPAKAVQKAESRHIKATADYHYRKTVEDHPEMRGSTLSRYMQKQKIKRQYAKQAREAAKPGQKHPRKQRSQRKSWRPGRWPLSSGIPWGYCSFWPVSCCWY